MGVLFDILAISGSKVGDSFCQLRSNQGFRVIPENWKKDDIGYEMNMDSKDYL